MRIGLICRADNGGLGAQTHDFYRNMNPAKTLVIDISHLTGFENHLERYPDAKVHKGFLDNEAIEWITDNVDVIFTIEIPYNYALFETARRKGVKTFLQYNYEFLDYMREPELPYPDVLMAPSHWNFGKVLEKFGSKAIVDYLPVPVDRTIFKYRKREQAKTFIHVAGHTLYEDRNGTEIVIEALNYLKKGAKIIIYSQHDLGIPKEKIGKFPQYELEIREGDFKYRDELYKEGDVLIFPRRYGGLSLQLNEAMSSGIVPIMTDVMPQNTMLKQELLLAPIHIKPIQTRGADIDCYGVDPRLVALKIDEMTGQRIGYLSDWCNKEAEKISWETMKPKYERFFEEVCRGVQAD